MQRADQIANLSAAAFLRDVGARLVKGERVGVRELPDGSGELVVRYTRFGDMLAALEDIDTLRAMAELDARARVSGRKARG